MKSQRNETPSAAQLAAIEQLTAAHAQAPGALLPLLHAIQDQLGYVPDAAVPIVARALNLSRAEVHGVVTFYHLFRTTPPGQHVLYLCRAEACQAMGARALEKHVREKLKVDFHETTADGRFSLEPVYCLGNCACSPAVMVDETVYGRVTPKRFDELLMSEIAAKAAPTGAAPTGAAPTGAAPTGAAPTGAAPTKAPSTRARS